MRAGYVSSGKKQTVGAFRNQAAIGDIIGLDDFGEPIRLAAPEPQIPTNLNPNIAAVLKYLQDSNALLRAQLDQAMSSNNPRQENVNGASPPGNGHVAPGNPPGRGLGARDPPSVSRAQG